jgi:signal transduction histidine kinase
LPESPAIVDAWARYSGRREKATFATANLLICLLVPAWSVFDFILEPEVAPRFLSIRVADVALTAGIWVFLSRSSNVRWNRWAMWLSVVAVGVSIATMLPAVPDHYALYTLGFSLVFWGCGLLLIWPLPWVLGSFGTILAAHVLLHLFFGDAIPPSAFIGSLFYVVSAAIISGAQHIVRLRLEYEAFRASFVVEQQNAELARTVAALEQTQTRLNATGTALTESLDLAATGEHVVSLSVPAFASWAVLVARASEESAIRAAEHVDPSLRLQLRDALSSVSVGAPNDDAPSTAELIVDAGRAELVRVLGSEVAGVVEARSLLVAPLVARGHRTGTLVFGRTDRNYAPNEIVLVEEVAHRAALALDNARLFREVEEAVRARDEFISVASHELRTPLTPLRLTLEGLLGKDDLDDRTRPGLQRAERQVARLSALVDQLLDVNRIAEGRVELEYQELDLGDVVREVTHRFQADAERSGSTLEASIEGTAHGRWDRSRVDQVLSNLLSNAIKYGRGGPITVSLAATGDRVRVRVEDRGIGISAADQARIFHRFERAASKNYGGFGLGLWIASKLVEQMGGTIRVESEPAQGSTFLFELPIR